jgi:acyl-[acyl-carrier-protein] desaturase
LVKEWGIEYMTGLTDKAEKARDYLMSLPARLRKVAERTSIKAPLEYEFNWIYR